MCWRRYYDGLFFFFCLLLDSDYAGLGWMFLFLFKCGSGFAFTITHALKVKQNKGTSASQWSVTREHATQNSKTLVMLSLHHSISLFLKLRCWIQFPIAIHFTLHHTVFCCCATLKCYHCPMKALKALFSKRALLSIEKNALKRLFIF